MRLHNLAIHSYPLKGLQALHKVSEEVDVWSDVVGIRPSPWGGSCGNGGKPVGTQGAGSGTRDFFGEALGKPSEGQGRWAWAYARCPRVSPTPEALCVLLNDLHIHRGEGAC